MSARRRGTMPQSHHRLDIQGLRMVAVVLVILDHLFGWPRGGFIGVDVFFVISGFLITGTLLRDADKYGRVAFTPFYRRRVRRIVPAATLTLVAISAVSAVIFSTSRAISTWWDSIAAFFFLSNWRFAVEGTDYFTADGPLSPVRHFWSLSVEEQFYFVWPAMLAGTIWLATRRNSHWNRVVATVLSAVVVSSLAWAIIDSTSNPTWAYFSTLTRVWELAAGALIALLATHLTAIPDNIRPAVSWTGLALIALGAAWITEEAGFPGPWAIIPVAGSALVIIGGTGGTVRYLQPLTNPVSVKIGDLSYSLYLWHWPVIVFLGVYMDPTGWQFYIAALGVMAGLSTLAYYFVEQPILNSTWLLPRDKQHWRPVPRRRDSPAEAIWRTTKARFQFEVTRSRQLAALISMALLIVGLGALSIAPREAPAYISNIAVEGAPDHAASVDLPPAVAALQSQLIDAVKARQWPDLNPTMDAVISGPKADLSVEGCGRRIDECWFGAESAPRTMVLLGDSIAMSYLAPLRDFAEQSGGQWKLLNQSSIGCPFANVEVASADEVIGEACPVRNESAIDTVNALRPDVVIIVNTDGPLKHAGSSVQISEDEWRDRSSDFVDRIAGNAGQIALMTPPPPDKNPIDCYVPGSVPADCVGELTSQHLARAETDASIAAAVGGQLIDTRNLFCTTTGYCPMFAGVTPMKRDRIHISPAYAASMTPAFIELLSATGMFSPQ